MTSCPISWSWGRLIRKFGFFKIWILQNLDLVGNVLWSWLLPERGLGFIVLTKLGRKEVEASRRLTVFGDNMSFSNTQIKMTDIRVVIWTTLPSDIRQCYLVWAARARWKLVLGNWHHWPPSSFSAAAVKDNTSAKKYFWRGKWGSVFSRLLESLESVPYIWCIYYICPYIGPIIGWDWGPSEGQKQVGEAVPYTGWFF